MKHKSNMVLIVGLGSIGQRHVRNLKKIVPDIEIYAYREKKTAPLLNDNNMPNEDGTVEIHYQIKTVDSLEEAFSIGIRTVFICNPSNKHMDIMLPALKAGCDIFIEKPLDIKNDRIDKARSLIKQHNNQVFVGCQYRYHPCISTAKRLMEEKAIGDVICVRAEMGEDVKTWHKYEDYRESYACRKELGGGVILTQIHELDYLYYIFGMPHSIYAVGGVVNELQIDVESLAEILMTVRRGDADIPISVHQDYFMNPPKRSCIIVGTCGRIELDLISAHLILYINGNMEKDMKFAFRRNDMFESEIRDFLSVVKGEITSPISFQDGVNALEIALAAKKSLQEKRKILLHEAEK